MKNKSLIYAAFALLAVMVLGSIEPALAGGPLFVASNGTPVLWPKREIKGGPLNSNTVNAQNQIVYRVDMGPLGTLSNAEATKFVDRIFKLYTDIPTSTIEFVNGGPILDPRNGQPVDINKSNVGLVLSGRSPSFQNPIVFDSDGSITGSGGVLGFFGPLSFSRGLNSIDHTEGFVVLNGATINLAGGKIPFVGVFTHEFGHLAGPLDHSEIYGSIASGDSSANVPDGFADRGQRFDVFAPFTETVYPFIYDAPSTSKLAAQGFGSSGSFIASLSFDDALAMSMLYPAPGFLPTEAGSANGGITGKVMIRTSNGDIPVTGLNVIARRVSKGMYPPSPSLDVFGGKPSLDGDGVPLPPDASRPELDPLITSASYVSGELRGDGAYQFLGLPPGDYMISVERINPGALGGSGIGPRSNAGQINLAVPENYSGTNESNDPTKDNPKTSTSVTVVAGAVNTNIDVILNGFGVDPSTNVRESEPNEIKKQAQKLSGNTRIMGTLGATDKVGIMVDFGDGTVDPVQDLYRVDLKTPTALAIFLKSDPNTNVDIYLFNKSIPKKGGTVSINSPIILDLGITSLDNQLISTGVLPAGTYYIGVAPFDGTGNYTLDVLPQKR